MIIREFQEADSPQLSILMNHFEDYYAGLANPPRTSRAPGFGEAFFPVLIKSIYKKHGKILVALEGERVIGFVAGVIKEQEETERIAEGEEKNGFLTELFVEEQARKNGIGSKLIERMESYFREQGCSQIFLEVESMNENVVKFYAKAGYREKRKVFVKSIV